MHTYRSTQQIAWVTINTIFWWVLVPIMAYHFFTTNVPWEWAICALANYFGQMFAGLLSGPQHYAAHRGNIWWHRVPSLFALHRAAHNQHHAYPKVFAWWFIPPAALAWYITCNIGVALLPCAVLAIWHGVWAMWWFVSWTIGVVFYAVIFELGHALAHAGEALLNRFFDTRWHNIHHVVKGRGFYSIYAGFALLELSPRVSRWVMELQARCMPQWWQQWCEAEMHHL